MTQSRAKRSVLWKISRRDLVDLLNRSKTLTDVFLYFGMRNHGGNFNTLIRRLKADGIDYSKFSENKSRGIKGRGRPLTELLVENSPGHRGGIKKRLIAEGLLTNHCYKCNLGAEWHGEQLVLVLDHINGINDDYRLENLRLLCPNCNSQTDTFAGRNVKRKPRAA
jgi:hypothetical protein